MDDKTKNDTLSQVFQVFDAIDTTESLKAQVQQIVISKVHQLQMKMIS